MRQSGNGKRRAEDGDAGGDAGDRPVIAGRYRIDLRQSLPRLDTPSAKAYAAADRDDAGASLFALVAQPTMPARMEALQRLQGTLATGFLAPLANGVVRCPLAQRNTIAIVYDRPGGGTLAEQLADGDAGLSQYDLPPRLIAPIAAALQVLADCNVTHRAIRPDNIWFMDRLGGEVALGDCLTAPPAHDQPLLFEPIERAMAERIGRGDGNTNDDLYAFGVTVALVVLRHNPLAGLDDDQVLTVKLERGSYEALCGRHRVPMSLMEPLRGMLCDDAEQRWGIAQLNDWLEGRRRTPLRSAVARTPASEFRFQSIGHTSLRQLAHALSHDIDAAAAMIRGGELQTWLAGRLKAPELAAAVTELTMASAAGTAGPRGSNAYLVARVAILLDPRGPIRYRGRAFMLDGLGPCLAAACLQQQDVQPFAEAIALGLPNHWLAQQSSPPTRWNEVPSFFTGLQAQLESLGPGGGWERCLYELNPGLPCQSPHLAGHYVCQLDAALLALDAMADHAAMESAYADRFPVDRHVAAFAASRYDRESAPYLKLLASSQPEACVSGMLGLLALLQIRVGAASLPGLATLFGNRLGPVIATYRSRTLRLDIERQLPKAIQTGRLLDLYVLVENPEWRRRDAAGFRTAAAEFASAERAILALDGGARHAAAWTVVGQRLAATVSLIVSSIAIGVMLLLIIA